MIPTLKNLLFGSRLKRNISWIFVGNVLHAIFAFLLTVYAARILSVDENGLINYISAIITFFTTLATLGLPSVVTRFFAQDEQHSGTYIATAFWSRFYVGIFMVISIQVGLWWLTSFYAFFIYEMTVYQKKEKTSIRQLALFSILGVFLISSAEASFFLGGFPGIVLVIDIILLGNYTAPMHSI